MRKRPASDQPSPVEVKRLPWMRRIHFHSPKLARSMVLYSYKSVDAWALMESSPLITGFCEYPGYVLVDGQRVLANFLIQGRGRKDYLVLDDIGVAPEDPACVAVHIDAPVVHVGADWFNPYRQWIDNWLRINPYLAANASFITPEALQRVDGVFGQPRALYDAVHALREMDRQLARTAIFMLLHQGKLRSDDLMYRPLNEASVFYPSETH